MSEQQFEKADTQPEPAKRPRIRVPQKRARIVRGLSLLGQALDAEFDPATIEHLMELHDDELEVIRRRLFDGVDAALRGRPTGTRVTNAVKVDNLRLSQKAMPIYYHWDDHQLENLRRKLDEFGDDVQILHAYAMSVVVRLEDGRVVQVNRRGEECISA